MKPKTKARLTTFFSQTDHGPGCYNKPDFLAIEEDDPLALEGYALHVLKVGPRENLSKEIFILDTAEWLAHRLSTLGEDESRVLCRYASVTMINVLEEMGVWCFGVNGSLSVFAPPVPENPGSHLRIRDDKGKPGHTWVIAPPFLIVDVTAKFQGWTRGVKAALPPVVLEREPIQEPPLYDRWVAPHLQSNPMLQAAFQRHTRNLWTWLPCHRVEKAGVTIHYLPGGVTLSEAGEEPAFAGFKPSHILRDIRRL